MGRLIGTLSTTPPSIMTSPSMTTGGKMDGMAAEASTASTTGPRSSQRSRPSVREVTTTSSGTAASSSSAKSTPSSTMRRSPLLACTDGRCWRKVQGPCARPRGKTCSPLRLRHTLSSFFIPTGVGSPQ